MQAQREATWMTFPTTTRQRYCDGKGKEKKTKSVECERSPSGKDEDPGVMRRECCDKAPSCRSDVMGSLHSSEAARSST